MARMTPTETAELLISLACAPFNYTSCAGPGQVVPTELAAQPRASADNRGVPGEPLQPLALAPAPA